VLLQGLRRDQLLADKVLYPCDMLGDLRVLRRVGAADMGQNGLDLIPRHAMELGVGSKCSGFGRQERFNDALLVLLHDRLSLSLERPGVLPDRE
jgi:hypothetical protein